MKELFTLLTLIIGLNTYSQTPAFPCAEGFGKYAKGGRGGVVIQVTHLKDHHIITEWRDDSEPSGSRRKTFANIAGDNLPDIWKVSVGLDVNTSYGLYNVDVSGETRPNIEVCAEQMQAVLFAQTGDDDDYPYYVPDLLSPMYDGSIRKAINTSGPRTVVFTVGGQLDIYSPLVITNPYITIAGQTAPGDGIMITNSTGGSNQSMIVAADHAIIRYLTFRRTEQSTGYNAGDNLYLSEGFNIIVDHCSFSWSSDGNLDIANYGYDLNNRALGNLTVQYSLFTNSYGGNNKSMLISGSPTELSLFRNAYINSATRNPSLSSVDGDNYTFDGNFEVVNCFWYDTDNGISLGNRSIGNKYNLNFINNYRKFENNSTYSSIRFLRVGTGNPADDDFERVYSLGNDGEFLMSSAIEPDPEYRMVQFGKNSSNNQVVLPAIMRRPTPFNTPILNDNVTLWDADSIQVNLLPQLGNYIHRDAEDLRAINDVLNGTSTFNNTINTFPTYNSGTPITDANNDGIEDSWFASNVPNGDTYNDTTIDGYTWLEEYLNSIAGCGSPVSINNCSGKNAPVATITLPLAGTYNKTDTVNFSINYTSDTTVSSVTYYLDNTLLSSTSTPFTFKQSGLAQGNHTIYAVVQDACGNTSNTDTISITVTPLEVMACNTLTPPVIDGIEDVIWNTIPSHNLGVTENGLTLPDTNDLKATYKIAWDATSLYIFIKVNDDTLISDSPGINKFHQDDAVCVFIDALDEDNTSYDANDYYIGIRQGGTDIAVNNVLYSGSGITKSTIVTTNGYNMEIKIDWSFIGITPTIGNDIGLDFRVDDDDNGGPQREHHAIWNDETSTLWNNPSKFGVLKLINTTCQNTTDIKIQEEGELTIYPNPTNGEVTIKSESTISKIEIYNIVGAIVFAQDNINTKTENLNLNKLPKGVYSIKVYQKNKIIEQQLIKQ